MRILSFLVLCILVILSSFWVLGLEPSGASVNEVSSSSGSSGAAASNNAIAGNITLVSVSSSNSVTQTWQGYYGNVSGGIRLADSTGNVLYNWSATSPSGEVYSSTNQTISWTNIQCFNMTATGTYTDESGNGGTTNQDGTNQTILEQTFNFNANDVDSINNTFSAFNHDAFFTANQEFSANECPSLQLYNNNAQASDGNFEEVLLYEPTTSSLVFTTILDDSIAGFDGSLVDFEMLVLEDGHGADTSTTTYYFFIEIE